MCRQDNSVMDSGKPPLRLLVSFSVVSPLSCILTYGLTETERKKGYPSTELAVSR